jgi:hypothetical protein
MDAVYPTKAMDPGGISDENFGSRVPREKRSLLISNIFSLLSKTNTETTSNKDTRKALKREHALGDSDPMLGWILAIFVEDGRIVAGLATPRDFEGDASNFVTSSERT